MPFLTDAHHLVMGHSFIYIKYTLSYHLNEYGRVFIFVL